MEMKLLLYLFVPIMLVTGCASNANQHSDQSLPDKNSNISLILGEEFRCTANEAGTFELCSNKKKGVNDTLRFIVFDREADSIIFQRFLAGGEVGWENAEWVKITHWLGNRTKDKPEGYDITFYSIKKRKEFDEIPSGLK